MSVEKQYRETLQLPQTDFPMKANLPQTEPQWLEKWKSLDIYKKMVSQGRPKKFVMPDGPPYANGNIHVGHVLNKVLKDIVIKYKNMSGSEAHFIPGWDCHGLPIELKVTQKLGEKKKQLADSKVRELCRAEALTWVDKQREQFRRLGVLADWDRPYLTLNPEYEAEEVRVLAQALRNGVVFQGEKPVYWCPTLQTALAAAEVEFHEHKSPSIYVKFYVEDKESLRRLGAQGKPLAVVIWTTTPWTLPANYALAFHKDFEYAVYDSGPELLVLAKELKESVEKACSLELKEMRTFKGSEVELAKARHPFMNRDSLMILAEHVTLETGTGIVHTAPSHGMEDYVAGLKYQLPVQSEVDAAGCFTERVPKYNGLNVFKANPMIVVDLKASGHLLASGELVHQYAHNPRSKTPLIFRSTPQWFIKMDHPEFNLRQKALSAAESEIEFFPAWGKQRLTGMLTNTPDWCISRQRVWGVPIPVFYCESCGEPLAKPEVMERVAEAMEASGRGLEAYFTEPVEKFTQEECCEKCGSSQFKIGRDILDVWFDSGVCHTAVQKKREGLGFPADIYLEGSDQHRGWFQTSLISSLAAYGRPPYKALITHGFVNDAQGLKMSKSAGNTVDPLDVIKKSGAEILRLWVAYEDYGQDVGISEEMFQRIGETYRRIRNTIRFMLGNLFDFDPAAHSVRPSEMTPLDLWALGRLNEVIRKSTEAYENYDFYKIYHALNNYFTVDLSAVYLDVLKDRLYTGKKTGQKRRSSQTVLFEILQTTTTLMAPILSFLAEETLHHLPGEKPESVFLKGFPVPVAEWEHPEIQSDFSELLTLRSQCSKAIEELRRDKKIGSSLDAHLKLKLPQKLFELVAGYQGDFLELLIVSQLEIEQAESVHIQVQPAQGEKCVRCWHYSDKISTRSDLPGVCPKCVEALA